MAKVLIVEDDPLINRMYQKIFASHGHEVEVADNGEEGLTKVTAFQPDLMLLDIMMPKLNGLELLKDIKGLPETAHTSVVVLTNLSGTAEAEAALHQGAAAFIIKSDYKPQEVYDMAMDVLENRPKTSNRA